MDEAPEPVPGGSGSGAEQARTSGRDQSPRRHPGHRYRARVRYGVDLLLLASVLAVAATGVMVDQLDLHQFRLHAWAGYVMVALTVVHVGLNRRALAHLRAAAGHAHRTGVVAACDPAGVRHGVGTATVGDSGCADRPPEARTGEHGPHAAMRRPRLTRRAVVAAAGAGVTGAVAGWSARAVVSPGPYPGGDVGLFYHRESSLGLGALLGDLLDWGAPPDRYKRLGGGEVVALPALAGLPTMSVAQALAQRRSLRTYADRPLTTDELAWLVHAATGLTSPEELRTAPSAGALYPIETYVAVNRVEGLRAGLYHVDVRARALEPVRTGSVAGDLALAGLGQDFLRRAPVVVVLTGLFQRTRWKYRQRHYRYVCWEAGHIAQNLYLAAEAAGLGACVVGAFLDGTTNDLLRVDGRHEAALGLVAVGAR